ncbi:MAG TPA: outer membrane beta-barrel protein [Bryobacteraceae bacterium]|jgi:hypothetical protein|nr:outer membrane beta-barrel protein [Bryobacteraceae bacterium]
MRFRFVSIFVFALGLASLPASAQFLNVGVKAGVPLNDGFNITPYKDFATNTVTNPYIIGPEVGVNLPFHLGIEFDALYRHYRFLGQSGSEWQFPLLLKYRFKGVPLVRPFVDAGPVFNHVSDIPFFTQNQNSPGFAVGGGLDFHFLLLHVTPEFRYVRIADTNYFVDSGRKSNQNQAQFLVGFTF